MSTSLSFDSVLLRIGNAQYGSRGGFSDELGATFVWDCQDPFVQDGFRVLCRLGVLGGLWCIACGEVVVCCSN